MSELAYRTIWTGYDFDDQCGSDSACGDDNPRHAREEVRDILVLTWVGAGGPVIGNRGDWRGMTASVRMAGVLWRTFEAEQ